MAERRRVNIQGILADADLRRELMVSTIQATQAREGIETTPQQANRAYYVVTEAENAAFFDLERYRGGKRSEPDQREERFVRALRDETEGVRFDVARRDFRSIDTSPLAYRRVGLVAHLFREAPALDPAWAIARQGKATGGDPEWIRYFWEVFGRPGWVPFAKGGSFSRFYSDVHLVIDWREHRREALKSVGNGLPSLEHYFKPGLTWPLGGGSFSLRLMPDGCVFAHKGPAIFPRSESETFVLLGILNSVTAEYLMQALTSRGDMGGRWEVGVIKRLPVPEPGLGQRTRIAQLAQAIYETKAGWDTGNETSTRFERPWLLRDSLSTCDVAARLDQLAEQERAEETRIQRLYAELNDEVYRLYGLSETTRRVIEETMGQRPPEILWPDMEGKDVDRKRLEHIRRLLSFVVKRVVEADLDGIVPFMAVGGETALAERVRAELASLFPQNDVNSVEVGITNELKRRVKGCRSVETLDEWLRDEYFDYHNALYQKRPIVWHIASSLGRGDHAFGALVHYHKFDYDRMAKLRGTYVRDALAHFRREAGLADREGRTADRLLWQGRVEDTEQLDRRLQWVQEGVTGHPAPGDCRIRTPWKADDQQPTGWRPDLDDGVGVNITPLQTAGVLRVSP